MVVSGGIIGVGVGVGNIGAGVRVGGLVPALMVLVLAVSVDLSTRKKKHTHPSALYPTTRKSGRASNNVDEGRQKNQRNERTEPNRIENRTRPTNKSSPNAEEDSNAYIYVSLLLSLAPIPLFLNLLTRHFFLVPYSPPSLSCCLLIGPPSYSSDKSDCRLLHLSLIHI